MSPGDAHGGRAQVALFATGGTIASAAAGPGGVAPSLTAADLVAVAPVAEVADVTARSFLQVPGAHLSLDDVISLAGVVAGAVADGAAGVVVTQGTDTIEETAFVLDLLVHAPEPVVVTGALRDPTVAGADGPANVLAAVAVAASAAARGLGTLVVVNDEVHAARFVRKSHTSSTGAFTSYPGPVGWVSERRPRIVSRPVGRLLLPRPAGPSPCVGLVSMSMGDDGRLLACAARADLDGLVIEALGGGHVPPGALEPLTELAGRIPVVLASSTRRGELLRATYGFAGSETDLAARGVVHGGWLDARKARLLLALLLGTGADRERVVSTFAEPYAAGAERTLEAGAGSGPGGGLLAGGE